MQLSDNKAVRRSLTMLCKGVSLLTSTCLYIMRRGAPLSYGATQLMGSQVQRGEPGPGKLRTSKRKKKTTAQCSSATQDEVQVARLCTSTTVGPNTALMAVFRNYRHWSHSHLENEVILYNNRWTSKKSDNIEHISLCKVFSLYSHGLTKKWVLQR